MTRKQLPFFLAFLVLMFGAMACACLGSGAGIGGFQATANAVLTQAAGAATAAAQGNSLSATANAAATQAIATANAATNVEATATDSNTNTEPTATTAAAEPTSAGSNDNGNGTTASGGPSDIPLMTGDNTVLIATDQLVSFQTKSDFAAVVAFYKDAMPNNGWTINATNSVETPTATVLQFNKDTRTAAVTIGKDPSSNQTLVTIAIQ